MAWDDDSWRDSYDAWKLASPDDDYDDRENQCDHEDYDVDILTGRASCDHCLANWYVGEDEIVRQIEHQAAYDEQCERENRRQWWRDLFAPLSRTLHYLLRPFQQRPRPIIDDDIPF